MRSLLLLLLRCAVNGEQAMKSLLLGVAISAFAVPALVAPVSAAGTPQLSGLGLSSLGSAQKAGAAPAVTGSPAASPAATGLGSLPLAPVVVDLGLSTPGFGSAAHSAPPPTTLPGLADVIPYYDNSGTGGRMNADLEVDTYGQKGQAPVNIYGLAFTDPPQHPLHLIGDLAGIPVDQRVDLPAQ
jgi:hypothetical protein